MWDRILYIASNMFDDLDDSGDYTETILHLARLYANYPTYT